VSFIPYAVSWNLTSRCNLACGHCYLDAGTRDRGGEGELSTEEALKIVSQIAEVNPGAVLILTGGEPLMYGGIYEVCEKASELGLMVVLGTVGTLLTPKTVAKLKEAGVAGVGVTIDSLDAKVHDSFRQMPAALKAAIKGLETARDGGLEIQVQTNVSQSNIFEIPLIAEWAHHLGARVFNLFFLVCTGRGQTQTDITPDAYEDILKWAADNQDSFDGMMVRPKCAPHFKRILHQRDKDHPLLKTYIAACRAGTHYFRITPEGMITPCPYMPEPVGDLKTAELKQLWENSPGLLKYRSPEYGGKCGLCRYRLICGGCRARAFAMFGDDMAEDQRCLYEPAFQEEAITNADTEAKFGQEISAESRATRWTKEAKEKLGNIPVFARSIVELGVEKYANEHGIEEITPEVMRTAAPPPGAVTRKPPAVKKEKPEDDIPWDPDARIRIEDAPEFVRPGILKLLPIRARERGIKRITTEFVSEIRNESMMLVTRRMKRLGFQGLDVTAFQTAKEKYKMTGRKTELVDSVVKFLGEREDKNEMIIEKFASYFEDDSSKMGWTKEATARLEKAPVFIREKAKKFVQKFAREHGYKYVTETAVNEAMSELPFGMMMKK